MQLPLLTASLRCLGDVFVRGCCFRLDVSHLMTPQSTLVCPSVVDASPCSPTVLSCGWWSVDVDETLSVQRAAAAPGVASV